MKISLKYSPVVILLLIVYVLLTILSLNYCYFWDNIQQISKEAHWFYTTDFSCLLMPAQNSGAEIVATGYHPPLMGIMTAALWKLVDYKLWVSHVFVFFWFLILIYNAWKLISKYSENKYITWISGILLIETTVLTQFVIASPDFILLTSFVLCLRAIVEKKNILLVIGLFFLCGINMRGIFVGAIMCISHIYYNFIQEKETTKKTGIFIKTIWAYLPVFVVLCSYFVYYLSNRGWFFENSPQNGHYSLPTNVGRIAKHFAEFGLRSVENGRIIIWIAGFFSAYYIWKKKYQLSNEQKFIFLVFLLLTGLYLLFVFVSQMPFSARYFMPQFFILTILSLSVLLKQLKANTIKLLFICILLFEISGNFWIYPEKIAKAWDCTLAHLPYYELREDCFKYIDKNNIPYNELSAGFCLYGNRQFIELNNNSKTVGTDKNLRYFLYSNISNLDDQFANELKNKELWIPLKSFEKGFVKVIVYERLARPVLTPDEK